MVRSKLLVPRFIVSFTWLPDGPRTLVIWSWMVEPLTLLPSTATTTSPGCSPALSDGDQEIGLTTTRTQFSERVAQTDRLAGSLRVLTAISRPMPLNYPQSATNACR